MASNRDEKQSDTARNAGARAGRDQDDSDREAVRRELKSGQFDPNTAHQPQELRKHPTEGEKTQLGDAAPGVVPEDAAILPDEGKPVPESLSRSDGQSRSA